MLKPNIKRSFLNVKTLIFQEFNFFFWQPFNGKKNLGKITFERSQNIMSGTGFKIKNFQIRFPFLLFFFLHFSMYFPKLFKKTIEFGEVIIPADLGSKFSSVILMTCEPRT